MDDFNLSFTFSLILDEIINIKTSFENIYNIYISNCTITDEFDNLLYSNVKDFNNSGVNYFIKSKISNENKIDFIYNIYSYNNYPKSRKICLEINTIDIILKTLENGEKISVNGNWKLELDVPQAFYERSSIIYRVNDSNCEEIKLNEFSVYNTGTKIELSTQFDTQRDDISQILEQYKDESDEVIQAKLMEYAQANVNQIQDNNKLNSIQNEYIENEKGEKFYLQESVDEKRGIFDNETGIFEYFASFELTKYDVTDKLFLNFEFNGEKVKIELIR